MKSAAVKQSDTECHVKPLEFICKASKILGIIPLNHPSKNQAKCVHFHKVYVIILAPLFIAAAFLPIRYRYKSEYLGYSTLLVLDTLNEFCLAMMNILTIFSTSFWHPSLWTKLNDGFASIDQKLQIWKTEQNFIEKASVRFTALNVLYLISVLDLCYVCWENGVTFANDLPHYVSTLYSLNIFVLIDSILMVFKYKYEEINVLVASTEDVKTVKEVSTILKNMTEDFNVLFGWTLLFMVCRGVLHLLMSINYALIDNPFTSDSINMIVASNGHSLLLLLPIILLATSCGRVKAESEKAELLCYKTQREDSQSLALFLKSHAAKFSACGYFEMDKSTICGFLTTTATYLIVLIQFNAFK